MFVDSRAASNARSHPRAPSALAVTGHHDARSVRCSMSVADMHAIDQSESCITHHSTSHREVAQEFYKMINEKIRSLRDRLDDARQDVIASRDHDPANALESRTRSYNASQALKKEVGGHGRPVFLPHKLRGDEAWYVQVLWPNGSENHISTFQTENEALSWIQADSIEWSKREDRIGMV